MLLIKFCSNQEFLKNSTGFTLERDGSIKVTENFKVEGLEDVYAIGKYCVV